jgi:predicted Zn-dependent peptidase
VGSDMRVSEDLEQVHIAYAFPGVASDDPDIYAAQVYATALGGGMSSRLFQEAREKRGLCYSIYSFAQASTDSGTVGVYTGTGENEAAEISSVIAGEMAALAQDASEAEIARAKAQIKSATLMGFERPSTRTEQIAANLLAHGRVLSIEEMTAKLDAVDTDAVRRFGERLMNCGSPSMAAVGPVGKLESHEVFAARFGAGAARRAAE